MTEYESEYMEDVNSNPRQALKAAKEIQRVKEPVNYWNRLDAVFKGKK